jgi:hypothetical protein
MLPQGRKDTCLLSPPHGLVRFDFYSAGLTPARVQGSGQECPLYTSHASGRGRATGAVLAMVLGALPQRLKPALKTILLSQR